MRTSSQSGGVRIRAIRDGDRPAVLRILVHSWGSGEVVTRGRVHPAHAYPGFVAVADDCIVGLLTYRLHPGAVARSRRRKPSIPKTGMDGIPLRDQIEMCKPLRSGGAQR